MESILLFITLSLLVFVIGAAVGSFLNVVIARVPKGEEIVRKWSYCPKCKKTIDVFDLIPIISYFLLLARCRNCGEPISLQYPIVEFATGSLFLLSFLTFNFQLSISNFHLLPHLLHQFFIISVLIVVFVIDAKAGIIPDSVVKTALIVSLLFVVVGSITATGFSQNTLAAIVAELVPRILTAASVAGFFGLLILATAGRGMGAGDAKFGFWLGFVFGIPKIIQVLFLSFVTGAVVAIFLLLTKRAKIGQTIPFGPFLAAGALVTLFAGDRILQWYLGIL